MIPKRLIPSPGQFAVGKPTRYGDKHGNFKPNLFEVILIHVIPCHPMLLDVTGTLLAQSVGPKANRLQAREHYLGGSRLRFETAWILVIKQTNLNENQKVSITMSIAMSIKTRTARCKN